MNIFCENVRFVVPYSIVAEIIIYRAAAAAADDADDGDDSMSVLATSATVA